MNNFGEIMEVASSVADLIIIKKGERVSFDIFSDICYCVNIREQIWRLNLKCLTIKRILLQY